MGTRFIEGFTFNLFSVYLLAYAVKTVGVPKSTVLNAIMAGAVVGVVLVMVTGRLSDRFGRKPVYNVGTTIALLFAFPAAWLIQGGTTLGVAITFIGGLGVIYGIVYGPLAAFWSELFDTRYRYTALSTLYQVSGIVASGFTPLIAAWLVARGDGTLWLVAGYNVAVAALSLVCAALLPETRGRDLQQDVAGETARLAGAGRRLIQVMSTSPHTSIQNRRLSPRTSSWTPPLASMVRRDASLSTSQVTSTRSMPRSRHHGSASASARLAWPSRRRDGRTE